MTSPEGLVTARAVRVRYATPQRVVASKGIGDTILYEITMMEGVPIRVGHDTLHLRVARWRADNWFHAHEPLHVAVVVGPTSGAVIDEQYLDGAKTTWVVILSVAGLAALAVGLFFLAFSSLGPNY